MDYFLTSLPLKLPSELENFLVMFLVMVLRMGDISVWPPKYKVIFSYYFISQIK